MQAKSITKFANRIHIDTALKATVGFAALAFHFPRTPCNAIVAKPSYTRRTPSIETSQRFRYDPLIAVT